MLRSLVRHEVRLAWRDPRTRATAAAVGALALAFGLAGAGAYQARAAEHAALSAYGAQRFSGQGADHPHAIAHRGYVVSRPPPALGFLDAGLDGALGRWLTLDAHRTRPLEGAKVGDLTRAPGAGRLDLGLLFSLVLPGFVVLLGHDAVAGEKRRGTFAMLRAAGLRPAPWLVAKGAGLATRILLAAFAPAALVAGGLTIALAPAEAPRLCAWLAVQALGLAAWGALTLALSAHLAEPRRALGLGLMGWGLLTVVVPPLASTAARVAAEPPPPGVLSAQLATWAESAHAQSEALRDRAVRDVRRRHPAWDGTGEAPEVLDAVMLRLADQDVAAQMQALLERLAAEQAREAAWAAALSFASPGGLAQLAGSAVAGSDLAHARLAEAHYEAYRRRLMAWINQWWAENGQAGFEAWSDTLADLSAAPRPSAPPAPPALAWAGCKLPCLLLLLACAAGALAFALKSQRDLRGAR